MRNKEEDELRSELRDDGMHDFEITQLLTALDELTASTGIEFGESKLFDLPLDMQKEMLLQEMDAYSSEQLNRIDEYHAGKKFTNDGLYLRWAAEFISDEIQQYIEGKAHDKDFAKAVEIASKQIKLVMNMKLTYAYFKKGVDLNIIHSSNIQK